MPYPNNGTFDPFARQRPPKASALSMGPVPDSKDWSGYGITDPTGKGCPPHPADALAECIRAMQQVLADTLQLNDLAAWIHPPYRGYWISKHVRAVLSVTAAVDAAANAAGIALEAANETVAGYDVALLEMSTATDYQTLFTFDIPRSSNLRVKSWGISVGNGLPESIVVRVKAPGATGGEPSPPNPFTSGHRSGEQEETFLLSSGGTPLEIEVALRDFANPNPVLIDFAVSGWVFPISKRVDSREGTRLRSGYGVDCK